MTYPRSIGLPAALLAFTFAPCAMASNSQSSDVPALKSGSMPAAAADAVLSLTAGPAAGGSLPAIVNPDASISLPLPGSFRAIAPPLGAQGTKAAAGLPGESRLAVSSRTSDLVSGSFASKEPIRFESRRTGSTSLELFLSLGDSRVDLSLDAAGALRIDGHGASIDGARREALTALTSAFGRAWSGDEDGDLAPQEEFLKRLAEWLSEAPAGYPIRSYDLGATERASSRERSGSSDQLAGSEPAEWWHGHSRGIKYLEGRCDVATYQNICHDALDHDESCGVHETGEPIEAGCNLLSAPEKDCLGRCGADCGDRYGRGPYTEDCVAFDYCCRNHDCTDLSRSGTDCGDEYDKMLDDYFYGWQNCKGCLDTAPGNFDTCTPRDPTAKHHTRDCFGSWGGSSGYGKRSSDLLWRNRLFGLNAMWLLDGLDLREALLIDPLADFGWEIVGTGDFNKDKKTDILWRHSISGTNAVWFMDGPLYLGGDVLPAVPDRTWKIVATADFDHDGYQDILWHNSVNGDVAIWLMDGIGLREGLTLGRITDTNWQPVAAGDMYGDRWADIVWRHGLTGDMVLFYMKGTEIAGFDFLGTVTDPGWKVIGLGQFDNDGRMDIVWQHSSTGMVAAWRMDGINLLEGVPVAIIDPRWAVVGPQ